MTKLTEDILRAQTCPFEIESIATKRRETVIFKDEKVSLVMVGGGYFNCTTSYILKNYKLPEPESKLVTMYECIGSMGELCFKDEEMRTPLLSSKTWTTPDKYAVRNYIIAGVDFSVGKVVECKTKQLDISSDPWNWVME